MGKGGMKLFDRILLRRIQSTGGNSSLPVDELVKQLRSDFPDYGRHKPQEFTKMVKQFLDTKPKSKRNHDDDVTSSPVSKKAKKIDSKEEPLQSDSSESESESSSEEDISAVSTSNFILQSEPEVDLTASMLRNKYGGSKIPKNLELEVVNNSNNKAIDMMKEDIGVKSKASEKPNSSLNDNGDVKDDGPRFKDLGGMNAVLHKLKMEVIVPLYHPDLLGSLGVRPISGILLHGPPGCGKTTLAHAIANETGFPFYQISAAELVSGISGASEENIRELFSKAHRTAPSIVFIDEIDAIAAKRENVQREMERRIVTQLMTCMDQSHRPDDKPGHVLVIAATNRPDALDPALRRPGRFDREITLGVPDEKARLQILSARTHGVKLEGDFDLVKLSRSTPGFVGADLESLVRDAGILAVNRVNNGRKLALDDEQNDDWWKIAWTPEEVEKLSITMSDCEVAAKLVQASSKREGFSKIPNVKWEDVGGLDYVRKVFDHYIVRRIKYPDVYEALGIDSDPGFLLYGPPGCGKTLIAKAVANEAGANFIYIKGPELLSKYVGDSELAVRELFSRARACTPCILFFDEIDAVTTTRGKEGGSVVDRVLNQLLIELDGADERKGVYVIGATNRIEMMDLAVLRAGRFGKHLYVPLANEDTRGVILKALARKRRLDADVDLIAIGQSEACADLTGADLRDLMNEAAMVAADEEINQIEAANACNEAERTSVSLLKSSPHNIIIKAAHFYQASVKIKEQRNKSTRSQPQSKKRKEQTSTHDVMAVADDISKIAKIMIEKTNGDDMSACIEKLEKLEWDAQDPMYQTALLLFGESSDLRKLWLVLKLEACDSWIKNAGRKFGLLG